MAQGSNGGVRITREIHAARVKNAQLGGAQPSQVWIE
jgi:hypothetical protein